MSLSRIFVLPLLIATPLAAAVRQRAVSTLPTVVLTGVIRDAANGNPVPGAIITSGTFSSDRNGTGSDGKYSVTLPANRPTVISVEDFAYVTQAFTYTPTAATTHDFALTTRLPAVTVKLVSGETHVLDLGTSQFAYAFAFVGYSRFDNANLCKPDGSAFDPSKTEIARITGPGVLVNFSPCCTRGPVLMVNVELKSGEKTAAYFNDSCFGSDMFFVGREPSTGEWQYLDFTKIAEIDFP